MINLAYKDISHSLSKFLITAVSVGVLLGIVIIMIGVYRGMIFDAKVLVDDTKADIWVVQQDTLGPFAQTSRVHEDLKNQIAYQDGIVGAGGITFQTFQMVNRGLDFKVMLVGYDPFGDIEVINKEKLIAGRVIQKQHYEIVVSKKTGYRLGDYITLGRDKFKVVGITKNTVSNGGDYLIFTSLQDAQILQFTYSNERVRSDEQRGIKGSNPHLVNAIVAKVKDGYDPKIVAQNIEDATHKTVFTKSEELHLLLEKVIKKSSKQIGMFTTILIIVSIVIIALIIYTMTLEKIKEISILKLIGISNFTISKMVIQETVVLGILAFISGNVFARLVQGGFPKRIVLDLSDAFSLFIVILIASIFASLFGIYKVVKTDPSSAIGG
ncbi:ABC transporter permease protein [hydrothermal vent metagenome]|uniref:ABC transporter permease protein n=1 Tax=hydrothermal vent metagenome TaxID=652676 RepID=A0A1W1D429_9ZZZZ